MLLLMRNQTKRFQQNFDIQLVDNQEMLLMRRIDILPMTADMIVRSDRFEMFCQFLLHHSSQVKSIEIS